MGGRITVDSQVGKGSVFKVELEFEIAHDCCGKSGSSDSGSLNAGDSAILSGCRILIAEDNAINAELSADFWICSVQSMWLRRTVSRRR